MSKIQNPKGIMIKTFPIIPEGNMATATYNGIDLETMKIVFSKQIQLTTGSAIEFISAVHGLMHMKKTGMYGALYIESEEIKKSIGNVTKMFYDPIKDEKAELTNSLVAHCIKWLIEQKSLSHVDLISNIEFPEEQMHENV